MLFFYEANHLSVENGGLKGDLGFAEIRPAVKAFSASRSLFHILTSSKNISVPFRFISDFAKQFYACTETNS